MSHPLLRSMMRKTRRGKGGSLWDFDSKHIYQSSTTRFAVQHNIAPLMPLPVVLVGSFGGWLADTTPAKSSASHGRGVHLRGGLTSGEW